MIMIMSDYAETIQCDVQRRAEERKENEEKKVVGSISRRFKIKVAT